MGNKHAVYINVGCHWKQESDGENGKLVRVLQFSQGREILLTGIYYTAWMYIDRGSNLQDVLSGIAPNSQLGSSTSLEVIKNLENMQLISIVEDV